MEEDQDCREASIRSGLKRPLPVACTQGERLHASDSRIETGILDPRQDGISSVLGQEPIFMQQVHV